MLKSPVIQAGLGFFRKKLVSSGTAEETRKKPGRNWKKLSEMEESGRNLLYQP